MSVSIIIPTVGRGTLSVVLEHLFLNNKFDQIDPEVIIVFDGKADEIEMIDKIKTDSRIKFLETGAKLGAAGARNRGIEAASGDIVVFIGDDTIPDQNWLMKLVTWHEENSDHTQALLGKVAWTDELAADPFHQWLNGHAQFDYDLLDRGKRPSWRHFYTSNISLKKDLLSEDVFNEDFKNWGFEDSELGYRLSKKGMVLHYDSSLIVKHDHPQTLEAMIARVSQSRSSARLFEDLHPEIQIRPTGLKKLVLQILVLLVGPFRFIKSVRWWHAWKKAWIG